MNQYVKLRRALEIFSCYAHEKSICVKHDQLFAGPQPSDVSAVHLAELERLGWHPDEGNNCFYTWV